MNTELDAKAQIARAIEANGTADASDYDLRAILEETHEFDGVHGWVQRVSSPEFWESVATHEKAAPAVPR